MKKNEQINQRILEKINSFQDPSLRTLIEKTLELAAKPHLESAIREQLEAHVLKLTKEEEE
jgi:hypothetical protein